MGTGDVKPHPDQSLGTKSIICARRRLSINGERAQSHARKRQEMESAEKMYYFRLKNITDILPLSSPVVKDQVPFVPLNNASTTPIVSSTKWRDPQVRRYSKSNNQYLPSIIKNFKTNCPGQKDERRGRSRNNSRDLELCLLNRTRNSRLLSNTRKKAVWYFRKVRKAKINCPKVTKKMFCCDR